MERTIYSKYSNERASRFCIRTDIVIDDAGEKKVYKRALTPEGRMHIAQIVLSCKQLNEAYRESDIMFCPCTMEKKDGEAEIAAFPFLQGTSLQDVLTETVSAGNDELVEHILRECIRRIGEGGGEIPFSVTEEFEAVFGAVQQELLVKAGKNARISARISDVDMILSNFFVDGDDVIAPEEKWQVIDYEWTFDFPIPKGFLIYRALYFAYYQVLYHTDWSIHRLLAMADITEDEVTLYQGMEEQFQKYLGAGALPVRNMQRAMGTRIVSIEKLLHGSGGTKGSGEAGIPEEEWLRVRKIQYQIDRNEYQDGSNVCSGWAFARTWDGRCLPVNIQVTDANGKTIAAEISRRDRRDVSEVMHIRNVTKTNWGFDCVWIGSADEEWKVSFSLGKKEIVYQNRKHS